MKYLLGITWLALMVASCDDFFNQVIEVDLPETESKMVLDCRVAAGDSVLTAFLSRSRGLLDTNAYGVDGVFNDTIYYISPDGDTFSFVNPYYVQYDTVPGVILELYQNDVLLGEIPRVRPGYYEWPHTFSSGETHIYRLEARAPGFPAIDAAATLPDNPEIGLIDFELGDGVNPFGEPNHDLYVDLVDPPTPDNYYLVQLWLRYDSLSAYFPVQLQSNDPLTEVAQNGSLILSDATFNGTTYRLHAKLNEDLTQYDAKVVVSGISRDAYLFDRSIQLYLGANNNPFAEPVLLYSNVNQGYGLFSISSRSEKKVE